MTKTKLIGGGIALAVMLGIWAATPTDASATWDGANYGHCASLIAADGGEVFGHTSVVTLKTEYMPIDWGIHISDQGINNGWLHARNNTPSGANQPNYQGVGCTPSP